MCCQTGGEKRSCLSNLVLGNLCFSYRHSSRMASDPQKSDTEGQTTITSSQGTTAFTFVASSPSDWPGEWVTEWTSSRDPNTPLLVRTEAPDLKSSLFYTTVVAGAPRITVYDIETQSYWAFTHTLWICFHQILKITVDKATARNFIKKCTTWGEAVEQFPKQFPNIKPATVPVITPGMVFFNALQDSIMVKREKKDSSLSQFCLDKLKRPYENHIQALIPFLRPEFVAGCTCLQMHTYGPLMYCPKCTKWKIE